MKESLVKRDEKELITEKELIMKKDLINRNEQTVELTEVEMLIREQELIGSVQNNREVFLEIYEANFQRIYNYAYYRTMNQTEAEEITSQTFLKALENIHKFEYRGIPLVVWLYKIASNIISDFYRKKESMTVLPADYASEAEDDEPEKMMISRVEKQQLLEELRVLPPLQLQAIVLRYMEHFSYKEIAQIMEKTDGAVKQLLHRGLTRLRERMVEHV